MHLVWTTLALAVFPGVDPSIGPAAEPPLAAPALLPIPAAVSPQATPILVSPSPAPVANAADDAPPRFEYEQATLERLQATLRGLALEHLPDSYVDEKDWNLTGRRVDAVKLSYYRGKLETRREWKTVNDGTWKRYEIELIEPERRLQATVADLRLDAAGTPRFRLAVRAPLTAEGQAVQWVKGVRIFSLGAQATADVELVVDGSCRVVPALGPHGPTLRLDPHVDAASLTLHAFRLDRVGRAGGDVAEELGEVLEGLVRKRVEDSGDRVAEKLNAAIDKRRDRLVLTLPEFKKANWGDWLLDRVPSLQGLEGDASSANGDVSFVPAAASVGRLVEER